MAFNLAEAHGFRSVIVANRKRPGGMSIAARWIIMTRNADYLERLAKVSTALRDASIVRMTVGNPVEYRRIGIWTDDFSNLLRIIR